MSNNTDIVTYKPKYEEEEKLSIVGGKRNDKRDRNQMRPLFIKVGVNSQANGSAYLELGRTKIICTVYGPRESTKYQYSEKAKLVCDFRYVTFSREGERKKPQQEEESKEISLLVQQSLESSVILTKFPKSVIDIYILVLQADGSIVSASINCASLALADAGIEMFDLVSSCSSVSIHSVHSNLKQIFDLNW